MYKNGFLKFLRAEQFRFLRDGTLASVIIIAVTLNVLSVIGTSSQMKFVEISPDALNIDRTLHLVRLGFGASLFSLIYGALSVTRDFGTRLVGRVKILSGSSTNLVLSRLLITAPGMVLIGFIGPLSAIITARFTLASTGSSFLWSKDATITVIGAFFAIVFTGYIGELIAWQTRSSLGTIIVLVIWMMLLEGYIFKFAPKVGRFLPGGLSQAIMKDNTDLSDIFSIPYAYIGWAVWLVVFFICSIIRLNKTDLVK